MKNVLKLDVVRAGRRGEDEEVRDREQLGHCVFHDIPSLEGETDYDAIFKLVSDALLDQKPKRRLNYGRQLLAFAVSMSCGEDESLGACLGRSRS